MLFRERDLNSKWRMSHNFYRSLLRLCTCVLCSFHLSNGIASNFLLSDVMCILFSVCFPLNRTYEHIIHTYALQCAKPITLKGLFTCQFAASDDLATHSKSRSAENVFVFLTFPNFAEKIIGQIAPSPRFPSYN